MEPYLLALQFRSDPLISNQFIELFRSEISYLINSLYSIKVVYNDKFFKHFK